MNLTFKEEIPFGKSSVTFEITGNVISIKSLLWNNDKISAVTRAESLINF